MADSRDLQILAAFVRALRDNQMVDDRVFEMRGAAIGEDELPAIDVGMTTADTVDATIHGMAEHVLQVQVEVCVREELGESPARTVDPYMTQAHAVVMTDATLGALVDSIDLTSREWVASSTPGGFLRMRMNYEVTHYTSRSDLTAGM